MNIFQFLGEGIRMAFKAIGSNKMRTLLTMLGMATGIFAITGILTMVNSLQTSVSQNLSSLGNTTFFVHHWPWAEGRDDWFKFRNRPKVSYRDFQRVKGNLDNVIGVSYEVTSRRQTIQASGRSASGVEVIGATHDMARVKNTSFFQGRYFSEVESHLGSPVCIIGYTIAETVFPNRPAVGEYLMIGKKRLKVIGVQTKQGGNLFPGFPSEDERIYVPYRALAKMYNLQSRNIDKVLIIKANDYEKLPAVEAHTVGLIRASRGLKPRMEDNFAINKQEALMSRLESVFGYLETGGWVISIFSILIGGFSIGNIMYISVKERTNEIGVQKALGSSQAFVMYQFLTESLLLCFIGGLVGILMVVLMGVTAEAVLQAANVPLEVTFAPSDILIGVGVSLLIGLLAGIIPASLAAKLDPVVAIRQ
ncbi:MAG: ABC transporter permease [Bacteroidota bacterium]